MRERNRFVTASVNSISRQCLTTAEEGALIGFINKLTIQGIPPTASIVRNLAEEMIGHLVRKNWTGVFVKYYQNRLKSLYLYTIDKNQVKAEYIPVFVSRLETGRYGKARCCTLSTKILS
jgi:hypothetical protein